MVNPVNVKVHDGNWYAHAKQTLVNGTAFMFAISILLHEKSLVFTSGHFN